MKRLTSSALVLLLAICVFLIDGANHPVSAGQYYQQTGPVYDGSTAGGGRFLIGYSPTLGMNLGLVVRIDGREAGAITKGHIYKTYLRPGRHFISVAPNGRYYDASRMILDVRRGQTYSYVAKYNRYHVLLVPTGSLVRRATYTYLEQ